ncbi:MerR family transcriptional regulator [Burkholderia diffusa]|uniref:MerR family transcriptional regulator n=1 Tax=Burkholderia diffusa TaxID=488732 RepID=UPI003F5180A1
MPTRQRCEPRPGAVVPAVSRRRAYAAQRRRTSAPTLRPSASAAAAWLGVSVEALRFHEQRGVVAPARTSAGYRAVVRFTRARRPGRRRLIHAFGRPS